jgi:hypothetical protein
MRLRVTTNFLLFRFAFLTALVGCVLIPLAAQQADSGGRRVLTAEDYKHAEKFMIYNVRPLVFHDVHGKSLLMARGSRRLITPKLLLPFLRQPELPTTRRTYRLWRLSFPRTANRFRFW